MKKNNINLFIINILLLILVSCKNEKSDNTFSYNMQDLSDMRFLPEELREVSGLSMVPNTTHDLACVQDEAGVIYIFDLQKNKIKKRVNFQTHDDFEAIEMVGNDAYLLTSVGDLYYIRELKEQPVITKIRIDAGQELEGMGYDESNNRLLIVPKTQSDKSKVKVYAYDLKDKKFQNHPIIHLSTEAVRRFCMRNNIKLDISKKKFPFKPSAIAVHPITKNIYILASVGKVLCVLSPKGAIIDIQQLDDILYPQPEGITFLADGHLVIASEGKAGILVILKQK
jgi:uncharacterized protein YjiK